MNFRHSLVGGVHWRSRRSASFCRFRGKLSVDMTLNGDTHPKFAILSFRPKWRNLFLFRAVARDYSFWVISSQSVIVRDVSTSVDMTELRSTATSRMLLPMKLRHSLVREQGHWPSRGSPTS